MVNRIISHHMNHQLIVTILGTDRSGILSEIADTVSDAHCNILDSRQAIYGKEFSLTMIIEGSHQAITRAELAIPPVCQRLDLLSMMKRTSHHEKQNLDHLYDVEYSGVDSHGLLRSVTRFFAERNVSISAFRQRTFTNKQSGQEMMRCKFIVNTPDTLDIALLRQEADELFFSIGLTGSITRKD